MQERVLSPLAIPENLDLELPRIARNQYMMKKIEEAAGEVRTSHQLIRADARDLRTEVRSDVHLVVTSPPYWNLKSYREHEAQLGGIADFEEFLNELDKVWRGCWDLLVPGGRLACVVGDVCLSRRRNNGRHTVVPLHAAIQERCRAIGFDNLAPIIWHKIANATYEVVGSGGFLGKPYEPNSVIKNDIEYILLQRKPGGYRKPTDESRLLSLISTTNYQAWFQQIWTGVTGASTRHHPAPYPLEIATRLVRMFSFVGDTVLDPFLGSGTTTIAAAHWGRNSIGIEIEPSYFDQAVHRIQNNLRDLFANRTVAVTRT